MIAGVVQLPPRPARRQGTHRQLLLARPLGLHVPRSTVKVWGNVAKATHGETRPEVLGSGDARQAFQGFQLRAAPLTYAAADTPLGAEGDARSPRRQGPLAQVGRCSPSGPGDRRYVTRTGDDDRTTIVIRRRGERGAAADRRARTSPPSTAPASAAGGNVRAGQITRLQTRPLAVTGVVNPHAAPSGGADRATAWTRRGATPRSRSRRSTGWCPSRTTRTSRVRARASARRARESLSDGTRRVVHLTIAGAGDIPIDPGSDLMRVAAHVAPAVRGPVPAVAGGRARAGAAGDRGPGRDPPRLPLGRRRAAAARGAARPVRLRPARAGAERRAQRGPGLHAGRSRRRRGGRRRAGGSARVDHARAARRAARPARAAAREPRRRLARRGSCARPTRSAPARR